MTSFHYLSMFRNTFFLTILSGFVLAGCDSNSVTPMPEPEPDIVQDDTQDGLDLYRARWAAASLANYQLGVYQRCVCLQNLILYNVTVEEGVPVSATRTSSTVENEPVPVEDVPYPTIDALFELVQLGFDSEADSVGARYVTQNGRPDQITIDFIRGIADEEINAYVDSFEELK